jgi:ComF family protein
MRTTTGTIAAKLRGLAGGLADLLLPAVCPGCDGAPAQGGGLCDACRVRLLSLVALPYCPRCGATIGPNIPIREDGCAACDHTLPRFCQVVRLGPYAWPLRGIVRALKYTRGAMPAAQVGRLLAQAAQTHLPEVRWDAVLAVPMHWRRRLMRAADHARVLAGEVAAALHLPLGEELIRVRHTPPQVHLTRTRRIANVRGAFAVRRAGALAGANVVLIDDVTTTGATANEATKTLLAAGAEKVALAVLAKAEPPTAYATHWA